MKKLCTPLLVVMIICSHHTLFAQSDFNRKYVDSIVFECHKQFNAFNRDSSLLYLNHAIEYMDRLEMTTDSRYFFLLNFKTACFYNLARYNETIEFGQKSIDYMEKHEDIVDINIAISTIGLVYTAYGKVGKYQEQCKLLLHGISLLEKSNLYNTNHYVFFLSDALQCLLLVRDEKELYSIARKIYEYCTRVPFDIEMVGKMSTNALNLQMINKDYAMEVATRVIQYAEQYLEKCDIDSLLSKYNEPYVITNLAGPLDLFRMMGNEEGGIEYSRRLYTKIHEYINKVRYLDVLFAALRIYNQCFDAFIYYGLFGDALSVLREYSDIWQYLAKSVFVNNPDNHIITVSEIFLKACHMFSIYYRFIGDYSKALYADSTSLFWSKSIFKIQNVKSNVTFCDMFGEVSNRYLELGDTLTSLIYLDSAAECYRETIGEANPRFTGSLSKMASVCIKHKDISSGFAYMDSVLNILSKVDYENDDSYTFTLFEIVKMNIMLNQYSNAIDYLNIMLNRKHNGGLDRTYILDALLYCQIKMKKAADKSFMDTLFVTRKKKLQNIFVNYPFYQCEKYWKSESRALLYYFPLAAYSFNDNGTITFATNALLLSKSILLNTDVNMRNVIVQSNDIEAIKMYDTIKYYISILSQNTEIPLYDELFHISEKLTSKVKQYGDITRDMSIEWTDVQKALNSNEAAIEFNSFTTDEDTTIYVAYVIRPRWSAPKQVVLAKMKKGESLSTRNLYSNSQLSRDIWKRLSTTLDGSKTIYFAPTGELYNIAIESLPDYEDSTRLISDRYNLYRLSSTRELAKDKKAIQKKNGSIYGGLRYDATIDTTLRGSDGQRSFTYFPWTPDSISVSRGKRVEFLPGTLTEAKSIYDFMKLASIKTTMFTDSLGTEFSFKQMSGSDVNVIQIGTHGFYYEGKQELITDRESIVGEDKSMTRSGLLFAGANMILKNGMPNTSTYNDGILTAAEIAQLDLKNVDMVVLSACESGLGELKGDGVFGLQRGFKKAGVNSIVMSLWKVDDHATQLLMTQFYENWLIKKMTKQRALKAAQEYVRNYEVDKTEWAIEQRKQRDEIRGSGGNFRSKATTGKSKKTRGAGQMYKPFQDPKYWAAFILLDGLD